MKKYLLIPLLLLLCVMSVTASSYSKLLVNVPLSDGRSAEGYLLVPDSAVSCPAVLLLHDHGAWFSIGKEKVVSPLPQSRLTPQQNDSLFAEARWFAQRCYNGAFVGDTLAANGYVVLCIDALYWGTRCAEKVAFEADIEEKNALNKALKAFQPSFYSACVRDLGRAWFEQVLLDDKASVSYLLSLPFVDKNRVGCFGFSYGAYRAWQLAAEDERVAVCVAANWMTTKKSNGVLRTPSDYAMFRPMQPYRTDYPDIAALIAPRPFLLIYGTHDHLFQTEVVEQCADKIAVAYKKSGSETMFRAAAFDDDHLFGTLQRMELLRFLSQFL
ncbi:MAG: dienelactone hydrolase family protein [Paludibacteraceae bacterium]|nr:dienelactone hydrolase family protein [Paludibacteraceae bacterium]